MAQALRNQDGNIASDVNEQTDLPRLPQLLVRCTNCTCGLVLSCWPPGSLSEDGINWHARKNPAADASCGPKCP